MQRPDKDHAKKRVRQLQAGAEPTAREVRLALLLDVGSGAETLAPGDLAIATMTSYVLAQDLPAYKAACEASNEADSKPTALDALYSRVVEGEAMTREELGAALPVALADDRRRKAAAYARARAAAEGGGEAA